MRGGFDSTVSVIQVDRGGGGGYCGVYYARGLKRARDELSI
jgi:hypothetical protein